MAATQPLTLPSSTLIRLTPASQVIPISDLLPKEPVPQEHIWKNGIKNANKTGGKTGGRAAARGGARAANKGACAGEVVTSSARALRQKGSSFLRTHASKHGITNASRKLTGEVLRELTEHYTNVHGINMQLDASSEVNVNGHEKKKVKVESAKVMAEKVIKQTLPKLAPVINGNRPVTVIQTSAAPAPPPPVARLPLNLLPQHPLPQSQVLMTPRAPAVTVQRVSHPPPITVTTTPIILGSFPPAAPPPISSSMVKPKTIPVIVFPTKPVTPPPTVVHKLITTQSKTEKPQTVVSSALTVIPVTSSSSSVKTVSNPTKVSKGHPPKPNCDADVIAFTKEELSSCGTSKLRPLAAAHKVHNASRKTKDQVVEELWIHFQEVHAQEISRKRTKEPVQTVAPKRRTKQSKKPDKSESTPKPTIAQVAQAAEVISAGWVGDVVDDEEEKDLK